MTRTMLRSLFGTSTLRPSTLQQTTVSALTQHNQLILSESNISHVTLPPMFVVWRHSNPARSIEVNGLTHERAFCAACIVTERIGGSIHPLWKLTLVEQPLEALGRCRVTLWPDHWFSGQEHKIIVQRPSPNPEVHNKLFISELKYTRYSIRLENNQIVPILKVANPCLVLHSRFSELDTTYIESFGFTCEHERELIPRTLLRRQEIQQEALRMAQRAAQTLFERAQPAPALHQAIPRRSLLPPTAAPRQQPIRVVIPQHIVNTVIESLVAQEKECPILQTALEKETTCLTPCGHAMTTDAAARWIRDAHSCPECRSSCSVDQLQVWRA